MIKYMLKFIQQAISYTITYVFSIILTIVVFGGLTIVALIDTIVGGFRDEN